MKIVKYPNKLKERLHQLHYVEGKTISVAIVILGKAFPKFKKRMTRDRMSSLARYVRIRKGLNGNKQHTRKGKPSQKPQSKKQKEFITEARRLRQKGFRWQAIVDELKVRFPEEKIPTANTLSVRVKGRKYKSRNGNKQYHIAITSASGAVVNIDIPSSMDVEKLIRQILEA